MVILSNYVVLHWFALDKKKHVVLFQVDIGTSAVSIDLRHGVSLKNQKGGMNMKTNLVPNPSSLSKHRHNVDAEKKRRRVRREKPLFRGRSFRNLSRFLERNEKNISWILRAVEIIVKVLKLIRDFSCTTSPSISLITCYRKQEVAVLRRFFSPPDNCRCC